MDSLRAAWQRAREYDQIVKLAPIARRYFAMNAFDGVVTMIGVVSGARVAGVEQPRVVLVTGLTTAVAMGVSGFTGAYLTESSERARDLRQLEQQTLSDLQQSRVARASRFAVIVVTVVDGISPMLASLLVMLPFFFAAWLPSLAMAYSMALASGIACLALIGAFLGKMSGGALWRYALKTALAGAVAILVSLALGTAH